MVWAWLAVQWALASACVLAAGGSGIRRGTTAVLLALVIALPLVASLAPLQTVALCFASIVALLKTMQVSASGSHWLAGRRLWHLFGVDVPTVQRNPILSRSLAEFWGQRWNRVVGGWLREFFFAPLARRRLPQLGLAASFGASAAIHAWLIIGLGADAAVMMAAYFLLQGAALFVESRIGLRRAPPILGRAWAIGVVLAPLPLLQGPWTQALGTA